MKELQVNYTWQDGHNGNDHSSTKQFLILEQHDKDLFTFLCWDGSIKRRSVQEQAEKNDYPDSMVILNTPTPELVLRYKLRMYEKARDLREELAEIDSVVRLNLGWPTDEEVRQHEAEIKRIKSSFSPAWELDDGW